MVRVLDLRGVSKSCTDNPMVKFLNILNRGADPEVFVIASIDDLPLNILKLVASKSGYEVIRVENRETYYEATLRKK
ncbi:MAG: hypothetical protein RMI56_02055 [Sulfolobales archaeon]|nr:hypothetical protein [Sulfolobales archaeon]MDW8082560.1 hypothetical protein [Sulfolobales archaeon]